MTSHPFTSSFGAVGDRADFSPSAWAASFTQDAEDQWRSDLGGSISASRTSLVFEYLGDGCVSLAYHDRNRTFYAVGDSAEAGFVVAANGATVPATSSLALEQAWPIVSAFLTDPATRPDGTWIDADDLQWGEDF